MTTTSPRLTWPERHSFGNATVARTDLAIGPAENDETRAAVAVRLTGLSGLNLGNLTFRDVAVMEDLARALVQAAHWIRAYDGEVPDPDAVPPNLTVLTLPERLPCPNTRASHTYCTVCSGAGYLDAAGEPWRPVVRNAPEEG